MLSVVICEDDTKQLERMELIIKNYIMIGALDMEIGLVTENPDQVMEYIQKDPKQVRLYFLDVDLQHEMSGLTLASEIRKVDDVGKIVFVTTHGELSYLTFTYKVEAMDYIIKNDQQEVERRVRECIDLAMRRYLMDKDTKAKRFKIKMGDSIRSIPYEEILFFESGLQPHRILLHTVNRQMEFYGSIKELEEKDDSLYRCHKSFVINKDNIKEIDKKERIVKMINGEEVPLSIRAMRKLRE